jgi:ubiquitin carboxyl-terminal hydrolase 4/11/15
MADDIRRPEDEASLVLGWLDGHEDDVPRMTGSCPDVGTVWFLISTSWLRRWKTYLGVEASAEVCQGGVKEQPPGKIDNSQLLLQEQFLKLPDNDAYTNVVTKPGLRCDDDYVLAPPKAWQFLSRKYGVELGSTVKRYNVRVSDWDTQVEVTLKPISVSFLPIKGTSPLEIPSPLQLFGSHKERLADVLQKLLRIYNKQSESAIEERHIRLWKLNPELSFAGFFEYMHRPENDVHSDLSYVPFPGTLLDTELMIDEAEIADDDVIVAELRDHLTNFRFVTPVKQKEQSCPVCSESIANSHSCIAPKLSERRMTRNSSGEERLYLRSEASRLGLTGLQNLGNTCFMNSGLQCLSNTWQLTEYFLNDSYLSHINPENPLGTGGKLAADYAVLVKELWLESNQSFSPWQFKRSISTFAAQFAGYQQHDSQELLSFVLDGLHEDLNRVRSKTHCEEIEHEGMSDRELADLYWKNFKIRNESIVVDLMYGQYRSEVTCPNCSHVSLAFDPFLMLNVSIPSRQYEIITVHFSPMNPRLPLLMLKFMMPNRSLVRPLKEEAARELELDVGLIELAVLKSESLKEHLKDSVSLSSLAQTDHIYAYERPFDYESKLCVLLEIVKESAYSTGYNRKVVYSYTRCLYLDPLMTLKDLHFEVYRFLKDATDDQLDREDMTMVDLATLETEFEEKFPKLYGGSGADFYSLNLVNLNKPSAYNYTSNAPVFSRECDFCGEKNCLNCRLEFTATTTLAELYAKKKSPAAFRLEALFPVSSNKLLENMNYLRSHESVDLVKRKELVFKEQVLTIYDCLQYSCQPEQLDERNTCYCGKCRKHVQVTKKMEVYRLPKVLMIHLKRFKQHGYYGTKINKTIHFPIEGLDLTDYLVERPERPPVYDLYAVSNHYGSMSFGHYTAYAKNCVKQEWYHFDDSSVGSPKNEPRDFLISGAAYVLFYQQREA